MAQSEPCVGSDVPRSKFVTKEEFKTFASNLLTKLEELKSSILAPVQEPQANPFTEALKANTEALNALKAEVAALKASALTKDELKKTLTAIEGQSSAIQQIKADIISEAGKYVSDVATAGYCDTSKLKDEIKGIVDRALQVCPPSHPLQKVRLVPYPQKLTS